MKKLQELALFLVAMSALIGWGTYIVRASYEVTQQIEEIAVTTSD